MRKVTKLWKTKEGKKIRICDMTDSHLKNTIKMVERKIDAAKFEVSYPCFSGDMAQYYAEVAWEDMIVAGYSDYCPIYNDLTEELKRRESLKSAG